MSEQATAHHLRVKIGNAEFEATGTEESVKAQYQSFLEALRATPQLQLPPPPASQASNVPNRVVQTDTQTSLDPEIVRRAFSVRGDSISLNALPRTDHQAGDALMVLLWGFEHLKGMTSVPATVLTEAARTSGLMLPRIDRAMRQNFIVRAGAHKGTRYSLNNPGREHAESVIMGLYQ